jgi:hypothetical protein
MCRFGSVESSKCDAQVFLYSQSPMSILALIMSNTSTLPAHNFITPPSAGALLGVSGRTIHRWYLQGALSGWLTPGGRLRVDPRSVERLVAPSVTITKNNVPN